MRSYVYLLLTGCFLWGCNGARQGEINAKTGASSSSKDNYIVLLDVSDRILFNNQQQIPNDIAVIQSIYAVFKATMEAKDTSRQYYTLNDKLKLLAAPNWYYASIDLSAEQPDKKALLTDKTEKTLNSLLPGIYQQAVISNKNNEDSGADIWKYFNDYLTDDLDKDAQNTLFIVTDGYMNVKKPEDRPVEKNRFASAVQIISALKYYPDWEARFTQGDYGLLPVKKKFAGLRVILLQINPKEGWDNEYNLLTKIWGKWFTEMGISNYHFIRNDTITQVNSSLGKLMHVKLDTTASLAQIPAIPLTDSVSPGSAITSTENTAATPLTSPAIVPEKKPVDTLKKAIVKEVPVAPKENASTSAASSSTQKKKSIPVKKPSNPAVTQTIPKNDDILKDNGAANGFNTGIKKGNQKKN